MRPGRHGLTPEIPRQRKSRERQTRAGAANRLRAAVLAEGAEEAMFRSDDELDKRSARQRAKRQSEGQREE